MVQKVGVFADFYSVAICSQFLLKQTNFCLFYDLQITRARSKSKFARPLVAPRKPITVTENSNGTYNIVDGSATVQAAVFVGWQIVPVIVQTFPPASENQNLD